MGKLIVGIDPGLQGAMAFLCPETGALEVLDMPTMKAKKSSGKNKTVLDVQRLAERFDRHDIMLAVVETVSTRPGESGASALTIGTNYGLLLGNITANYHPYELVNPRKWKNAMAVPKDKNEARAKASALMPRAAHKWALKGHDGRAEAALLCLYGLRILNLPVPMVVAI